MKIRKLAAVVLALLICVSLAVPAMAASGYNNGSAANGNRQDSDGYTPSTSTGTTGSTTAAEPKPADTAAVTNAASTAIAAAAEGETAKVNLRNITTVNAADLKAVFAQAKEAGVAAVVNVDVKEGNVVLSRIYIKEENAAALNGAVDLSVTLNSEAAKAAVAAKFEGKTQVVSIGQKGALGTTISMAVMLDLSEMDAENLVIYVLGEDGEYVALQSAYRIDTKGYLHFETAVGGDIVVTSK